MNPKAFSQQNLFGIIVYTEATQLRSMAPIQVVTDFSRRRMTSAITLVVATWLTLGVAAAQQEKPPYVDPRPGDPKARVETDPAQMAAPSHEHKGGKDAMPAAQPVDTKTFVIGAEDVLNIRVWREPELSGSYNVRPDGKISLPLVNEIQAAGLTPEQLSAAVGESLKKYINRPEVSISVQAVNSRKYYIQGEVQRPGAYPLVVPTTVLEALVNAGGFREFANTKKIIILRNGKQRIRFNYKEVTNGKHPEQNIQVQPGDQIIVN
jgi:polysaccharide export outer membrane protein